MKQQILGYIRQFPGQTTNSIVVAHGMKRGSVSKLLTRLVRAGELERSDSGCYYIETKPVANPSPAPQSANA